MNWREGHEIFAILGERLKNLTEDPIPFISLLSLKTKYGKLGPYDAIPFIHN
jgi:hypothetical protein